MLLAGHLTGEGPAVVQRMPLCYVCVYMLAAVWKQWLSTGWFSDNLSQQPSSVQLLWKRARSGCLQWPLCSKRPWVVWSTSAVL
jgi:hypothetical protein